MQGTPFPSPDWDDFAVVVIERMAVAVRELVEGSAVRTEFSFMEGPFHVEFQRRQGGGISAIGIERKLDASGRVVGLERASTQVTVEELWLLTSDAAEHLFRECLSRGDQSRDAARLGDVVAQLRSMPRPPA